MTSKDKVLQLLGKKTKTIHEQETIENKNSTIKEEFIDKTIDLNSNEKTETKIESNDLSLKEDSKDIENKGDINLDIKNNIEDSNFTLSGNKEQIQNIDFKIIDNTSLEKPTNKEILTINTTGPIENNNAISNIINITHSNDGITEIVNNTLDKTDEIIENAEENIKNKDSHILICEKAVDDANTINAMEIENGNVHNEIDIPITDTNIINISEIISENKIKETQVHKPMALNTSNTMAIETIKTDLTEEKEFEKEKNKDTTDTKESTEIINIAINKEIKIIGYDTKEELKENLSAHIDNKENKEKNTINENSAEKPKSIIEETKIIDSEVVKEDKEIINSNEANMKTNTTEPIGIVDSEIKNNEEKNKQQDTFKDEIVNPIKDTEKKEIINIIESKEDTESQKLPEASEDKNMIAPEGVDKNITNSTNKDIVHSQNLKEAENIQDKQQIPNNINNEKVINTENKNTDVTNTINNANTANSNVNNLNNNANNGNTATNQAQQNQIQRKKMTFNKALEEIDLFINDIDKLEKKYSEEYDIDFSMNAKIAELIPCSMQLKLIDKFLGKIINDPKYHEEIANKYK